MDESEALARFARRFVRPEFRERFLHEARKKPQELHRRICHDIESVIDASFKGQAASIQPQDPCLFLAWFAPVTRMSWHEARTRMASGGGGYLVIKADGSAFYAETEGYPAQVYAGGR